MLTDKLSCENKVGKKCHSAELKIHRDKGLMLECQGSNKVITTGIKQ